MGVRDRRLEHPNVILKVNLDVIAADATDAANAPFRALPMSKEVPFFVCHFAPVNCVLSERPVRSSSEYVRP